MPSLKSVKRERFAVLVSQIPKTQWSLARCYTEAGYKAQGHSAESAASRLLSIVEVELRVKELMEPVVQKSRLTLDFLLSEIERTLRDAREDRAHGACIQALALVAKVHEMISEREAYDAPQFGGAQDVAEIRTMLVNQIIDDLGVDDAIKIAEQLMARVSDRALIVS
jgi:20S proteasome alpha/beta subunit